MDFEVTTFDEEEIILEFDIKDRSVLDLYDVISQLSNSFRTQNKLVFSSTQSFSLKTVADSSMSLRSSSLLRSRMTVSTFLLFP